MRPIAGGLQVNAESFAASMAWAATDLRWKGGRVLSTLLFHRVPRQRDAISPSELVLDEFVRVMDRLADHARVLPLAEALKLLAGGRLPRRAVAITFDDGYAEWLDYVAPVLVARQLPATFFVTTGHLTGGAMWHERINAAVAALPARGAQLPYGLSAFSDLEPQHRRVELAQALQQMFKHVGLAQRQAAIEALEVQAVQALQPPRPFDAGSVRSLRRQGFDIGAHTVQHPILNAVSDKDARDEIGGSKEQLEGILGERVALFAYPNGVPLRDFSGRHAEMVKACGFSGAVVTGGGVARRGADPYMLPRFSPWATRAGRELLPVARNTWGRSGLLDSPRVHRKPVVLFVENGSGFGGAIVALQTLLQALPRDRFDYHVITNVAVGAFGTLPSVRSHQVISDELIDFRPLVAWIRRAGSSPVVRALLFLLGRADDLVNRLPHLARLWWAARHIRPDIIHGNNEPGANREALVVAWLMGLPYVQHLRGGSGLTQRSRRLMDHPSMFVPVSRWLGDELLAAGVAAGRVRQIYDAVNLGGQGALPAFDLRAGLAIPRTTTVVAMVGMLLSWKGQRLFLQAVARLPPSDHETIYLVVGGEPERGERGVAQALQAYARELGIENRVRIVGQLDHISRSMAQFDVVVSASLRPEPLGLVMLEAMAAACVFVGPAYGAAPEVVVDGVNGFLFDPGVAESLAAKLTLAVDAARHRPALRQAARASVQAWFSPQVCAHQTAAVHAALCGPDVHP